MTALDDLRHHGDAELAPGLLDLAVNVATGPPPSWLEAAVLAACARLDRYPDARAATSATATRHRRAADEVLLTAGAAEAFTLLAQGLPRGTAAMVHPQFTEPEVALLAAGWNVRRVVLQPGHALDPSDVADDADLVILGNPTNPTGTLHPRATLLALRRPGRTVVVDEAFLDAVPGEPESLADHPDLDGVVVVRSLTKTWGLAGLRIGYLLGDRDVLTACARVQPHWAVSGPALAAAAACASPAAVATAARRATTLEGVRARLRDALALRGLELVDRAVGPFILTRHPDRHDLHARLRERGIAVRRADTFPGLDEGWIRVAVRDDATSQRLLDALDRAIDQRPAAPPPMGRVVLVGGGPGDDSSITVAGLRALQRADVVVADRLAPLGLLAHLPPHAEVVDAAKNPRGRAMPQDEINRALINRARAGRQVVRLKGGDPFVFGRGGEEVEACTAAGVPVEVIPGVTSAVAAPAAAGIPVTHRGLTHGFTVVSAHVPPGDPRSLLDWDALARSGTTLVVLMGVATLPGVCARLVHAGLDPDTPAVVVRDARGPAQADIRGTVTTIAEAAAHVAPPAVAVIGAVAGLELR